MHNNTKLFINAHTIRAYTKTIYRKHTQNAYRIYAYAKNYLQKHTQNAHTIYAYSKKLFTKSINQSIMGF